MTGASRPATQLDIQLWNFQKELEHLINRYSLDSALNIPDWLLAQNIVCYLRNLRWLLMERKRLNMFIDQFDEDLDIDPYQIERERKQQEPGEEAK